MLGFTVDIDSTNADQEDRNAATLIVEQENARRTELNNADPPPDPLWPMLPTTPAGALLNSYEEVLGGYTLPSAHDSYRGQSTNVTNKMRGEAFKDAPESVQDQVDALLEPYLPTP